MRCTPGRTAVPPLCESSAVERLFVYGTLAPGRANHHVLAAVTGTWVPATAKGTLLQEGWGADMGYPGIVLSEDGDDVAGFVFSSPDLAAHWSRLDAFEGDGYQRTLTQVRLSDGQAVDAYIYTLSAGGRPRT